MTVPPRKNSHKKMLRAVRTREDRRRQWEKEGERPLWKNLSMIGALGWLIVIPTLIGVLLGRWLDKAFGSGVLFSGALIFLGVVLGSYLVWQKITRE
jgi:ATP synthase protein I